MFDELLVISQGGQLLYSWHSKSKEDDDLDDDLISGFLTALNNFATQQRGEDIKSLKLKQTTIIFEKYDELHQKLTFVATTKNEELIELLHVVLHEVMNQFINLFQDKLNREFDGDITEFREFDDIIENLLINYGLDVLDSTIEKINKEKTLKSVVFLEPNGGKILYIHAKQYVSKDKISFLVPLLRNSSKLLYLQNLNQKVGWILLNTIRNEIMLVEVRKNILIVYLYNLEDSMEDTILNLDFFKTEGKYVDKPKKLGKIFDRIKFNQNIKEIYLVDLLGKIFYKQSLVNDFKYKQYIPETISFLTASKKSSKEIFNRELMCSTIGGQDIATICLNFNNFVLVLIGETTNFNSFQGIEKTCINIIEQLILI
ncbi:MAG: hypothetical protein GF317_02820 [Candidatus Lokiarchaeota archaeon]|nr:hypothetical protein [Candidatus Lokiarchaeota archaeon]MBD3198839.1 hypothetical protein [Candidatus Lokiarchaeota archaeon]